MSHESLNLSEHFEGFIEAQVASGQYSNRDDVIQAGLRLLEKRERVKKERLEKLKALVNEGLADLDAGRFIQIKGEDELRAFIHAMGNEARARHEKG